MAEDLRFELEWTTDVDMDLSVTEPDGFEISYSSGPSPSGGDLTSGDKGTAGDSPEIVSWPTGQTPEGENFIARATYYTYNNDQVDAEFTLRVYRGDVLYQEETGIITIDDLFVGARLDYREYELCSNVSIPAAAVGMIEMGGVDSDGQSCIIPNDPPGACWEYGWTWSGNADTPFSNSGYGPGGYTAPDGAFPGRQNLSSVSVYPPDQEWQCEGTTYVEMRTASPSSLWAPMAADLGAGFGPGDGVCSDSRATGASWAYGGLYFAVTFSRNIVAASITCNQALPYDVFDSVFVQFGYGSPYPTVTLFQANTTTRVGNFAAALALGPPAGIGAGDNKTIWRQGSTLSDTPDNTYAIYPPTTTIDVDTFYGATVGGVFNGVTVIQDGPY